MYLLQASGTRPWAGCLCNVIDPSSAAAITVPTLQMSKLRLGEGKSQEHTAGQLQTQASLKPGSLQGSTHTNSGLTEV